MVEEKLVKAGVIGEHVAHLTCATDTKSANDVLKDIIQDGTLKARTALGRAVKLLGAQGRPTDSQRCVCFTDAPMHELRLFTGYVPGRQRQFEPYGIAITKEQARSSGVNPVWYIDQSPGHRWLTRPVEDLVKRALSSGPAWASEPILELTPFIEVMGSGARGSGERYTKEFSWEREWRHVGDFALGRQFVVICPEDTHDEMACHVDQVSRSTNLAMSVRFVDLEWPRSKIDDGLAGRGLRVGRNGVVRPTAS